MRHLRLMAVVSLLVAAGSALAQGATPLPMEAMRQFSAVFELLRQGQAGEPTGDALMLGAIRGMVAAIDPDGGEFYTREELAELRADTAATRSSLGLQLQHRPRAVLVAGVTPGGPAAAAGLQAGDLIDAVDGRPVGDLRAFQVNRLLDGAVGSTVTLDLIARGERTARRVVLQRGAPARLERGLDRPADGQAVLRPGPFQEATLAQLAALLGREWTQQRFDSLVLDLRGHPGGLLDVSIGVAAMFLPANAPVLKTVGRLPEANQTFRATAADYARRDDPLARLPVGLRSMPLVVLVDDHTASGAEIVAAALQDHRRAPVVGQRTFGRGSIQTIRLLPEGTALKYTTAVWESPAGKRLDGRGVTPDIATPSGDATQALATALAEARRLPPR